MRGRCPDVQVLLFSARDKGICIHPGRRDRLFQVVSRLRARTEFEGTGLGLALYGKMVERHGGGIWVESQGKGKGSAFRFTVSWTLREGEVVNVHAPEIRGLDLHPAGAGM
jgi:light-regulated signal transduction histidine kinase (bacteriophytochrome)